MGMPKSRSWKKADYPNRKPRWQKSTNPKYEINSDRRDKYKSRLTWFAKPKDYIRNYKLYKKYAKLTKTPIDPGLKRIAENLERNKKLYGKSRKRK